MQTTYKSAGVDIDEGARAVDAIKEAVHSTYTPSVVGDIGGFGGLFSISSAKDMQDPLLVSGTDGVGTKLQLARLANKHTSVGIDLVAMCVNDILATGAKPLFFLDYVAVGKLQAEAMKDIVSGIAQGCRQAGCALIGGEMAEHPGVMPKDDYDLSGFCVGIVDKPDMLLPEHVHEGDVLIGLPSSGFHSNGYSLIRKVCEEELAGKVCVEETFDGKTLLEALLCPTRIYVQSVLHVLEKCPSAVHSLAHITGGGITENLNRALSSSVDAVVKRGTWEVPGVMQYVIEKASLSTEEAYKTFNMGLGLILAVDAARGNEVREALEQQGEEPLVVGAIEAGTGKVRYE